MYERDAVGFEPSAKRALPEPETSSQVVNSRRLRPVERLTDEELSEKNEPDENVDVPVKKKKYRMIRRHPAKIFDCTECGKTFKHPSKIAEHMRVHTGEKPFRCDICGAGFSQGNSLKVHLRIHRGERPYACDFCDRDFPTSSQKKSHEKTHLRKPGAEPLVYVCPAEGCSARYARKERMACHIQTSHPEIGEVVEDFDEKRIVINTVEDLIERVNEPEDVHEEQMWEQSGVESGYYAEIVVEDDPPHLDEDRCYSDGVGNEVVTLVKEETEDVLVSALNGPGSFVEDNVDSIGDEAGTYVVNTCAMNALPAVVNAELPDAVAVEGEGTEQIFVGSEEIVNAVQCQPEAVYDYVCESEEPYYDTGAVEQVPVHEDPDIVREHGSILDGEILVASTSMVGEPPSSYPGDVDDITGFDYNEPVPPPPVITRKRRIKRSEQGLLAGTHHLEIEPIIKIDPDAKGGGRHRIIADPRPPQKGRRREEDEHCNHKLEVDPAIFEMAAPVKRTREATERLMYAEDFIYRPARNLDWIIEAVARGEDIDKASPHNRRKPQTHRCEYCGRVDKYPSKIQAHMRTHTGEKPFKCDICGMLFSQRTPMRMHVRRHLNQRPYVCDVDGCGERFINGSLLNAHQNSKHFERKRYACMRGCGRSFAQARNQRKHEAKCMHRLAVKETVEDFFQSGILARNYGSAPMLRSMLHEGNLSSAPQKYEIKVNGCRDYADAESRQLVDGEQFLDVEDETHGLMENQHLDGFEERLVGQNIGTIECEGADNPLEEINLNTIKQETKEPEPVFDDTRQSIDERAERDWLL